MARDPFARATQSVLRRLGKDALLRGAPAGKVHVEHGVEMYERGGDVGEAAVHRSVATIEKQFAPKNGDALVLLDEAGAQVEAYSVQGLFKDDGYAVRRIVMAVPL
jgi:hypothetical protein